MTNPNHNWDEERLAELLRTAQHPPVPPDEELLARLRAESAAVFQSSRSNPKRERGDTSPKRKREDADTTPSPRNSKMFIVAWRALAATAAAVVLMATWFVTSSSGGGSPTLATVLEKTERAAALHIRIDRKEKPAGNITPATEAWTDKSGALRVNHADGAYDIARQEKLWQIDEKANRATSGESPYYRAATKSIDLLPLLGLDSATVRTALLAATARSTQEKIGGKEFDVYRYRTIHGLRPVIVEARVDRATQLLHSLETLVDRDGKESPAVTLTVLAANQPVNEDLFVVGDTLTEDGRIGKVSDLQGMVSVKPVMAERWTPVCGNLLLRPGDWLRTDLRGANAVAARLTSKSQVIAGPGTLVELMSPKKIRLYKGEIQLSVSSDPLELLGPAGEKIDEKMTVKTSGVYGIRNNHLARAEQEPKWLKGFLGAEVQESIGKLVANVDGRNVPLTVGYHKVSVDIRDQIARTTVEESFANLTDHELEGVFYFPLPADASISGFGMWIGNELVEADIVEKQRAREIYEIIKSEHRDPGLLEWQGGNLFSARIFPIPAHAEKRIRIIYTQVLPRVGNAFRYSYALQSEMLKQHPLRELSIDVKLNSAMPLKKVGSPTHAVRTAETEHSAHVEFDAREYTPTRDFEVVVELQGKQSELTFIPHRRGDDGYFMLMLAPPAEDSDDDRDLLTDKAPLDLILLADTSASLDAPERARQAEFIAAMLQSLTPRDTVNLACCNVNCDWVFDKAVSAEAKNVKTIRDFLDRRHSLGWTDLAKAFTQVFERAGRNTCIVYVGDGIPTVGDADPAAAAAQLQRLYEEKCRDKTPVCHAISVGSTFEAGVLKAIGSLGGGSMRQITGEQGPRVVALDLLKEITRPGLSDLKVQFAGLRVARVYPEQLPNLPRGAEQIILGRYLPEKAEKGTSLISQPGVDRGSDGSGKSVMSPFPKVIVTGRQGDRDVRFEKDISLPASENLDAEQGNSFIPRLWARMHLDYLLQQGQSPTIKDDIIALSEEYHIITPYTSLLVLETDADRERFKVKRSFLMRDAEKFFAAGRDNANFELVQQQMKQAGTWRIGLRASVLQQFSTLGRDAGAFQPHNLPTRALSKLGHGVVLTGVNTYSGGTTLILNNSGFDFSELGVVNGSGNWDKREVESLGRRAPANAPSLLVLSYSQAHTFGNMHIAGGAIDITNGNMIVTTSDFGLVPTVVLNVNKSGATAAALGKILVEEAQTRRSGPYIWAASAASSPPGFPDWNYSEAWLNSLFGTLPPAPTGKRPPEVQPDWPEEVLAISKNLLRTDQLALQDGGLRIDLHTDNLNARFAALASQSDTSLLASARSWLVHSSADGGQTTVQWCDGKQREVFNRSFNLGRTRKAAEEELKTPPIGLNGFVLASLKDSFVGQRVTVRHPADGRALLTFHYPQDERNDTRVLVDTKQNVVLSIESRSNGKVTSTQQFGDFVEVAGAWWAGSVKSLDEKGRVTCVAKQKIVRLDSDQYVQSMAKERAGREQVQFLRDPAETVLDAKKALALGKASFDDQITLLMHFARSAQWTSAMEHLAVAEKLADGKPGVRWLRYAVLKAARRNEELKELFQHEAANLSPLPEGEGQGVRAAVGRDTRAKSSPTSPHPNPLPEGEGTDALYLANYLLGQASGVLEANETLALLDTLRPVFARQPAHLQAIKSWKQQRANWLANLGRDDESLAIYRELAETYPTDFGVQLTYVQNLQNRQEYEAQRKWIERALSSDVVWLPQEVDQFRSSYAQSIRAQERYEDLASYLAQWIGQNPDSADPYTQYLDALYYTDRSADASALMDKWFREGRREDPSSASAARLQAAINWIMNQIQNSWNYTGGGYRIDKHWQDELVETAVFFCLDKTRVSITEQILNDWRFQQSGGNEKVRPALAKVFIEKFDRLNLDELNRFINWLRGNDALVTKKQWKDIARQLEERYNSSPLPPGEGQGVRAGQVGAGKSPHPNPLPEGEGTELKNRLAQTVANILSFAAEPEEYMAYLRRLSGEAPEKYRPYYIAQLFQTLLNQPWAEKYEDEAFELLDKLGGGQTPEAKLLEQIRSLHQLTDRMLQARQATKTIEHAEKLTRTELEKKQAEQLRQTREEFAARLAAEETKHRGELAVWIAAERMYLDVLLDRNLDKAAETCWKVLDAQPPKFDETSDDAAVLHAELDALLRNRCLITLMDLAARKTAPAELVRRTLEYLDQNIARELAAGSKNQQWKLLKFELLIALDRPKDLEKSLNDWISAGDADNRWRMALGYLLAEEGKLAEAIARFEAVAAADELGPAQWQTLADWYQAANRRKDYERAKIEIYKTDDEWRLNQSISNQMQPWLNGQGHLPSQLDPEIVLAFRALLSKSPNPQNYINYQLRELYKASRDFRLLSCLADSLPGHTAGQIYPYLQSAKGVVDGIREEAAVDELIGRIVQLRGEGDSPIFAGSQSTNGNPESPAKIGTVPQATTDVDRRAFDLLEAMAERRGAELRNQPGPHVDKAVAALKRASKRQWSPGEERLMADFLAALGAIPQEKLAAEQLRQLAAFYNDAKPDTQQRLDMACTYARALWSYNRRQAVLDLLESEVNRYAASHSPLPEGEGKPLCEQQIFQDFISYLDQAGQYTAAVKRLENERQHAEKITNRRNLEARVIEVHIDALANQGQVGDLKGEGLYRAVQTRIRGQLPSDDTPYDARLIGLLSRLYSTAHGRTITGVAADVKTFAFKTFPPLLKRQVQQYEGSVSDLCERVHQVCGPADGIAFLVDRYEQRPQWLKLRQNFWNGYGGRLTDWRREAEPDGKKLDPALSDRLLKLVLDELRDELLVRRPNYIIPIAYNGYPGQYWAEREGDYLRCAEEVYAQNKRSSTVVCNVADYLTVGLARVDRAIEILQAAAAEHILDEGGQWKLVGYLHNKDRFGESIGLLQALVEAHPDNLQYRGTLMYAYFRTKRKDELLGLLKQSDDYFHQKNRWGEGPLAMLAGSCLQTELFEQSVKYYKELIPLHERTAANRGIGDGTLSGYYGGKAQAFAGLKRMPEAVEAACAAIASWGNNVQNRGQALEALRNILRGCEKLDAYVAGLDAETAKTGSDNGFLRKALGQVYSERGQFDKAIVQLRLALDLQPNDGEIFDALIACCDKQGDKQAAIREVLAKAQFARRDLGLYKNLGDRLAALHEDREAERAYTSIVEVLVSEAESHAMLANVRESQNRWPEAIDQWRQVVRLSALEPTGLLGLAKAEIHEKRWEAAAETVRQLRAKTWPQRFNNTDFQIQELQRLIDAGKPAR